GLWYYLWLYRDPTTRATTASSPSGEPHRLRLRVHRAGPPDPVRDLFLPEQIVVRHPDRPGVRAGGSDRNVSGRKATAGVPRCRRQDDEDPLMIGLGTVVLTR